MEGKVEIPAMKSEFDSAEAWVDTVHREALASATGLDIVTLTAVEQHIVSGLLKASQDFPTRDFSKLTPEQLAKTVSYMGKFLDEIHRLSEFARGHADSRPEIAGDWMRGLTEGQLRQVLAWTKENADASRQEAERLHADESAG